MQSLPKYTRSDIALSCLGFISLEAEIDKRKLTFFGQLCHLSPSARAKEIFINRLIHYINNPSSVIGFMPDIHRILAKYGLTDYLYSYISNGAFPSKYSWKTIVQRCILQYETIQLQSRLQSELSLRSFSKVHNKISPCAIWQFSRENYEYTYQCITVMNLLSRLYSCQYRKLCILCGTETDSIALHLIMFCSGNSTFRNRMWNQLYVCLGFGDYQNFISRSHIEQCNELFTGLQSMTLSEVKKKECLTIIVKALHNLGKSLRFPYSYCVP